MPGRATLAHVLVFSAALLATAGCDAFLTPTPGPTPRDCMIGFRGVYQLTGRDGGVPSEATLNEAAQIVHARVSRVGFALFAVRTEPNATIVVELPLGADPDEMRALITSSGDISFVPIPEGTSVEAGQQLPSGLEPLFGREALQDVRPAVDPAGRVSIDITLTPQADTALEAHSRGNVGRQLAIAVDGDILTAPNIDEPLTGGRMQISGGLNELERQRLLALLTLPPMPGTLAQLSFVEVAPPPGCSAPV